ncbi:hypothetical protein BANT918_00307 [Brevibacterium antiquum CNRZ 918]|uniref:Uncharacterized protein n=1 Tax=Brevibacterium antiquum CNRZ 918 TaxID=1255637 RepID=A0A2H1HQ65_9MICO|nr:hypothetical protein BANT918_00307 [Brevibacterium antiquum CNRZ 918]
MADCDARHSTASLKLLAAHCTGSFGEF